MLGRLQTLNSPGWPWSTLHKVARRITLSDRSDRVIWSVPCLNTCESLLSLKMFFKHFFLLSSTVKNRFYMVTQHLQIYAHRTETTVFRSSTYPLCHIPCILQEVDTQLYLVPDYLPFPLLDLLPHPLHPTLLWVQCQPQLLGLCVTMGKLLNISKPRFSSW